MNCPACGAPNEADALFCAECGSPLEIDEIEATVAGRTSPVSAEPVDSAGDEPTTESEPDVSTDLPAAAETITLDSIPPPPTVPESDDQPDEPPASPTEGDGASPDLPEESEPVAELVPEETPVGEDGAGGRKVRYIIGGVALFLIIICCCCSVFVGAIFGVMSSEVGEEILRDLSAILIEWPVV